MANQKLLASSGSKESSKILFYGFKGQLEQKDTGMLPQILKTVPYRPRNFCRAPGIFIYFRKSKCKRTVSSSVFWQLGSSLLWEQEHSTPSVGVKRPGFKFPLSHSLALCPRANPLGCSEPASLASNGAKALALPECFREDGMGSACANQSDSCKAPPSLKSMQLLKLIKIK